MQNERNLRDSLWLGTLEAGLAPTVKYNPKLVVFMLQKWTCCMHAIQFSVLVCTTLQNIKSQYKLAKINMMNSPALGKTLYFNSIGLKLYIKRTIAEYSRYHRRISQGIIE